MTSRDLRIGGRRLAGCSRSPEPRLDGVLRWRRREVGSAARARWRGRSRRPARMPRSAPWMNARAAEAKIACRAGPPVVSQCHRLTHRVAGSRPTECVSVGRGGDAADDGDAEHAAEVAGAVVDRRADADLRSRQRAHDRLRGRGQSRRTAPRWLAIGRRDAVAIGGEDTESCWSAGERQRDQDRPRTLLVFNRRAAPTSAPPFGFTRPSGSWASAGSRWDGLCEEILSGILDP